MLLVINVLYSLQSMTIYSSIRVEAAIIFRWLTWNLEKVRGITSNLEVSMWSVHLGHSSAILVLYCTYLFHDSMNLLGSSYCVHTSTTPCEGSALVDPIPTTKTSQMTSPEDKVISMLDKQHHSKTPRRGWGDGAAFRSLSLLPRTWIPSTHIGWLAASWTPVPRIQHSLPAYEGTGTCRTIHAWKLMHKCIK